MRAVVFDLWGTLADTFPDEAHRLVMAEMAGLVGVDPDVFERGWRASYEDRMRGGTIEEHVRRLVATAGPDGDELGVGIAAAARTRADHMRRLLRFRPDVVPTLTELRRRGLRTGLVSICSSDVAETVAAGELAPLLDVAVYSCSEEVAKPDPQVFLLAAERLDVAPAECLFVDDVAENLVGAERAGMRAVQIGGADGWGGARISRVGDVLDLLP